MSNLDLYQRRMKDSTKISRSKLIDNKIKTFQRALDKSYNSTEVESNGEKYQALITGIPTSPLITKKNYAAMLEHNSAVGDEIFWIENDSYWLITEHDSTEKAIFQGSIQHALYELRWRHPKTGEEYYARACAKGPDETTISNGVKNSVFFDRFTDSLYLIVSSKVEGAEFLKRYFEIMINKKKWRIEVLNDVTHPDLLYIQLIERPIDRDTDTDDLVDGKKPYEIKIMSSLDGVENIEENTEVNIKPTVFRDGSVLLEEPFKVICDNCTLQNESLLFNTIGKATVTIKLKNFDFEKTWHIEVIEEIIEKKVYRSIIGNDVVKTLTTTKLDFLDTINGVEQISQGEWKFGDANNKKAPKEKFEDYFTVIEGVNNNELKLKVKNKTGLVILSYVLETDEIYTKEIKIVPLFGRS